MHEALSPTAIVTVASLATHHGASRVTSPRQVYPPVPRCLVGTPAEQHCTPFPCLQVINEALGGISRGDNSFHKQPFAVRRPSSDARDEPIATACCAPQRGGGHESRARETVAVA